MNHENRPFNVPPHSTHSGFDGWTQKLLAGIVPENLRQQNGNWEIHLGSEWMEMLASLPQLGEALVITGNPCAILGQTRPYPDVDFCGHSRHAQSTDGHFDFEFIPWNDARMVRRECAHQTSHFIEFRDPSHAVIHKVCLTDKTDTAEFVEWVHCNQAWERRAAAPALIPPARWRTVQQRHWFHYDEVDVVTPAAAATLLDAARAEGQMLRAIVGNEGVTQSATFIPQNISPLKSWTFASDDAVALHFDTEALGDAILHHVPNPAGGPSVSTLKCFDEDGCLRMAITPPDQTDVEEWNAFLRTAI